MTEVLVAPLIIWAKKGVLTVHLLNLESGVGAGIDSYYESLLKAYGLLGDPVYLHRFQTHYSAVERYMGAPGTKAFPFSFLSVFMHKPSERSRFYMDALQAFWPGLQVGTARADSILIFIHCFMN